MRHFQPCNILIFNFRSEIEIKDCIFEDNIAGSKGDDLFFLQDQNPLLLSTSTFQRFSSNSIYVENASVWMSNLEFSNNLKNTNNGGALHCLDCTEFQLFDSKFLNLKSTSGGAIYLQKNQFNDKIKTFEVLFEIRLI